MDPRAIRTVNAWWPDLSLEVNDSSWPTYLDICRSVAQKFGANLRTVDRALFMAGARDNQDPTLPKG